MNTAGLLLILFVLSAFLLGANARDLRWRRSLSAEEEFELEKRLQAITKPAVKSFKAKYGMIIDCVDIHKQLAFDHLLLKNHTIQMKPETIPGRTTVEPQAGKSSRCPQGTVPIVRPTKEDLLISDRLARNGPTHLQNILSSRMDRINATGLKSAMLTYKGQNYGAKARINNWSPVVSSDQMSLAGISIVNGHPLPDNIQAGWISYQYLYPNDARLYTYWTADGYQTTGCYNLLCPGFVQVSTTIPLGLVTLASQYGGVQYETLLTIYQEQVTGNWWLLFGQNNETVGYWPKSLFSALGGGASAIAWGGQASSPLTEASPEMGSGHFPPEGFQKAAYITHIQVADKVGTFVDPDESSLVVFQDAPVCYNATTTHDAQFGRYMFYGGRGSCVGYSDYTRLSE